MRQVSKAAIGLLALLLSACEMKLPHARTPPPPQPTTAKAEPEPVAAPSEPLSIPQTQVRLPNPQPIDPEALAAPPVNVPADTPAPRRTHAGPKRSGPQPPPVTSPGKPESAETAEAPPPAPTESPRPPIGPVLPDEERRRLNEDIASRLKEVEQRLTRIAGLRLSDPQKSSVQTIRSFVDLSHKALEQGDIQKANDLAEKALILAQELDRAR
jgi:protein TonB